MKNLFIKFMAIFIAFAVATCSKDFQPAENTNMIPMTFSATLSEEAMNDDTRATLGGGSGKQVLWQEGDVIYVYPKSSTGTGSISGVKFALASGAGTTSAVFSGTVEESKEGYYAFTKNVTYTQGGASSNGGTFNPNISETQSPAAGTFDPKALTLCGYAAAGANSFNLYHATGFFKLEVSAGSEHQIKQIEIKSTDGVSGKSSDVGGKTISGATRIAIGEGGVPNTPKNTGRNYITMNPASGTSITEGTYYLPAAAVGEAIPELYIVLYSTDEKFAVLKGGSVKIERNKVVAISPISTDALNWHADGEIVINKITLDATPLENSRNVSVSGSFSVFPSTADASSIAWKIQSKLGDGEWTDTGLSGTGATISGNVEGLTAGGEYSFRAVVNGNKYSPVVENVVVGSIVITYDCTSKVGFTGDGVAFSTTNGNKYESEVTFEYLGREFSFIGTWWYQSNKLCYANDSFMGLPAILGYKLSKVMIDNVQTSGKTVGIVTTSNAYFFVEGGGSKAVPDSGSCTFELSNTAANTRYYIAGRSSNMRTRHFTLVYVIVD